MQLREEESKAEVVGGDSTEGGGGPKKFKRKAGSKSRLLAKAKKFGKQGRLGKGFEVDKETYDYFLRVLELWTKNEFDNAEEKESFIENAFTQTVDQEINLSSNQMISRVIETILPHASADVLQRFATAFNPQSLRAICSDSFASHVLETLLEVCSKTDNPKLKEWFRTTSRYILNNLEETFAFDPYGNHVCRRVMECLTGLVSENKGQRTTPSGNQKKHPSRKTDEPIVERENEPESEEIFANFYQRFLAWPQFFDLFQSELTCGLVQTVLKACARVNPTILQQVNLEDGIKKTIQALGNEIKLEDKVQANLYTRVIEVCLLLSDKNPKMWEKIYRTYFQDKIEIFGVHEKGRFSVKKLIEASPTKENFELVFDEIHPVLKKLYEAKSTSTFVSLSEGCKKFQTKQSSFVQSVLAILGCEGATEDNGLNSIVMKIARFGQDLILKEDGTPKYITDYTGTLVLQNMLEFHKPLKVVSSILETDEAILKRLATDTKGSHVCISFFSSEKVGDKNKEKLLHKLKEYFPALAVDRFGSRTIHAIWGWANLKHRTTIVSSLSEKVSQLNANQFGKYISETYAVHAYKRDPKTWAEALNKNEKNKKEAEDIMSTINDDTPETPKSRKQKKKDKQEKELEMQVNIEENDEVSESKSAKKKKKNKNKEILMMEEETVEEEAEEPTPSKKEKRKKKKHHQQEEEADNVEQTVTEMEESAVETPKTKKRKKNRKSHGEEVEDIPAEENLLENEPEEEPKRKRKKSKV